MHLLEFHLFDVLKQNPKFLNSSTYYHQFVMHYSLSLVTSLACPNNIYIDCFRLENRFNMNSKCFVWHFLHASLPFLVFSCQSSPSNWPLVVWCKILKRISWSYLFPLSQHKITRSADCVLGWNVPRLIIIVIMMDDNDNNNNCVVLFSFYSSKRYQVFLLSFFFCPGTFWPARQTEPVVVVCICF